MPRSSDCINRCLAVTDAFKLKAAVLGYNIDEVSENGVDASSNPASIYFVQAGAVQVCATDVINNVTTCQDFEVSE